MGEAKGKGQKAKGKGEDARVPNDWSFIETYTREVNGATRFAGASNFLNAAILKANAFAVAAKRFR